MGPDLTNCMSSERGPKYAEVMLRYGAIPRMPNLGLTDQEIKELLAFLMYIDKSGTSPPVDFEINSIGTIDINTPIPDTRTGGFTVMVSVTGEVLDLSRRLPKKVAVIGPIQKRSGGIEGNEAIRNALSNAGELAGQEIFSRLNAKRIK